MNKISVRNIMAEIEYDILVAFKKAALERRITYRQAIEEAYKDWTEKQDDRDTP